MVKVSVIVPTFNRSALLRKTLVSIFNQTYQDYEIIVISNGSTDNTEAVIKDFHDPRLIYVHQEGSGSPASPRNKGILLSKGQLIAFCDDDDIWLPEKLEKQVHFLENNHAYSVCYTKMKRFNEQLEWVNADEETELPIDSKKLLYRNTIPLSSLIVRKKDILEHGLFDESKKIFGAEDAELVLRLSRKCKLHCISEYLTLYYSGANRFSTSGSKIKILSHFYYLRRLYNVYLLVLQKGFFAPHEVIIPFVLNVYMSAKNIIYECIWRQ